MGSVLSINYSCCIRVEEAKDGSIENIENESCNDNDSNLSDISLTSSNTIIK